MNGHHQVAHAMRRLFGDAELIQARLDGSAFLDAEVKAEIAPMVRAIRAMRTDEGAEMARGEK